MIKDNSVCSIILAAGQSLRMTSPKPLLKFNSKQNFIEKIIFENNLFGIEKTIVVTNSNLLLKIKKQKKIEIIVNDNFKETRILSIYLGLKIAKNYDYCFLQNVDNPFITSDILTYIFSERQSDKVIVPYFNNCGGHPVLLPKKIINDILKINYQNKNFKEILNNFDIVKLGIPKSEILVNINNNNDYQKYFSN